jgi:hypothetical protein
MTTLPYAMSATPTPETGQWLEIVRQKVEAMRFGSVQIIVHEGRVTQVESTEKTRLPGEPAAPATSYRRSTT